MKKFDQYIINQLLKSIVMNPSVYSLQIKGIQSELTMRDVRGYAVYMALIFIFVESR